MTEKLSLTATEVEVLLAIAENTLGNGGDFGFDDEIVPELRAGGSKLTAKQVSGVCGSLTRKGLYSTDIEFGQTELSPLGIAVLYRLGWPHAEVFDSQYRSGCAIPIITLEVK